MKYPTVTEVFTASPQQIISWWRNLGTPVERDEKIALMWITNRYKEIQQHPEFESLQKTIAWNSEHRLR